jgi:hypothetical protein
MTLEYEAQHVGDNVGPHKDYAAKGPALSHQNAEWGLQVRLFWQVLEGQKEEVCVQRPVEEGKAAQTGAFYAQLCHSRTVSALVNHCLLNTFPK